MFAMIWTPQLVASRIEEAADTLKGLPGIPRPRGVRSAMPRHVRSYFDGYHIDGQDGDPWGMYRNDPPPIRVIPDGEAIDRMDEVLEWMKWLDRPSQQIVWWRAVGVRWGRLCRKMRGQTRQHLRRVQKRALGQIARRLNHE